MVEMSNPGLEVDEQRRVLDATFERLAKTGLQADFVEKVAERAGVDARRIYLHFGGAGKLLQALMERELEIIAGSVPAPELRFPGETVGDELSVIAKILLDECRTHIGFLKTVLVESMRNPEFSTVFYRTFIQRGRRLFVEFLGTRQSRGELRDDIDVETAAAFFLSALIFTLLALEIFGGKEIEQVDDGRLIRGMSDVFLQGALPRA